MSLFKMIKIAMTTSAPRIPASEAAARIRGGQAVLVDVREPNEWPAGIAQGALLLPLSDLNGKRVEWSRFLPTVGAREVLLYCAAGGRSAIAARVLVDAGIKAANAGSLREWADAGWPIVRPPAARA